MSAHDVVMPSGTERWYICDRIGEYGEEPVAPCCACKRPSTRLCDGPCHTHKSKTCDRPICDECAHEQNIQRLIQWPFTVEIVRSAWPSLGAWSAEGQVRMAAECGRTPAYEVDSFDLCPECDAVARAAPPEASR